MTMTDCCFCIFCCCFGTFPRVDFLFSQEEVIFFKSNRAVNEGRLEFLTQRYDALCGSSRKYQRNIRWMEGPEGAVACGTWMVQRNQRTGHLDGS